MRPDQHAPEQHAPERDRPNRRMVIGPACVLVTGASSGLGAALAMHYAAPDRTLILWGRDTARLDAVGTRCRAAGAVVRLRTLDLCDVATALDAVRADDAQHPVALAILAAGLGDMRAPDAATERPELVLELALVNFAAPTVLATALGERMAERGRGQIALLGSVAAFHDLPYAAAYAGSKAGLSRFATSLRLGLQDRGVGVTLLSPGFVDTPMSRRLRAPKPFLLQPDAAAARIATAIARNRAHLVLPWQFAVVGWAAALLPPPLRRAAMRHTRAEQAPRPVTSVR